jgi:hypothetical protein
VDLPGGPRLHRACTVQTHYAVTTSRAVAVVNAAVAESALFASPVVVRRQRDGQHATAIFALATADDAFAQGGVLFAAELGGAVTNRFRGRLGEPAALAFRDFEHVDGFMAAARHAGFTLTATPEPPLRVLAAAQLGLSSVRLRTPMARPSGIRSWVQSRLLRHQLRLDSALAPTEAVDRLARALTPRATGPQFAFGRARAPVSPYTGTITRWSVRAAYIGAMSNSWAWTFEGGVYADEHGCALLGTVGPPGFTPVFSALWAGFVSLFLAGAVITGAVQLAEGHAPVGFAVALIPSVMLGILFGVTEFASRAATGDWERMEARLRSVLEAPAT